ncbi:MAG TPA: DinB family protein [Verrucomicrobiae bacterium]|nr:DinB family protein [Verrucomicrobiae bacterium]
MNLRREDRESLLASLREMPAWLGRTFESLSTADAARRSSDGMFAPVEQCWHLADLEREGFAERLRRLRDEDRPVLADWDGERAAIERAYRQRTCADGIAAFAAARRANLALIASIRAEEWERAGTQNGVGPVALCDLPAMMAEHDASHRREIEAWLAENARPVRKDGPAGDR